MSASISMKVTRGPESWAYIYVALGFAVSIEGTAIDMATSVLPFPVNLVVFVVVGALTFWLFLSSGWFQNKLIGLKSRYEQKGR